MNSETLLLQIAAESPDLPGHAGDLLRARLAQQAALGLMMDIQLAHARSREAVVTGARMALRCGALLLRVPACDLDRVLRVSSIGPQAAIEYVKLADDHPNLARIAVKRRGRIGEAQAMDLLKGTQTASPWANLQALIRMQT